MAWRVGVTAALYDAIDVDRRSQNHAPGWFDARDVCGRREASVEGLN